MLLLRALVFLAAAAAPSLAATFGTVVAHAQPLADLAIDEARRRVYVVNTASNQVEVYSTTTNPPRQTNIIRTEDTPLSIAMSRSGRYLYVACYNASSINVIDLNSATFSSRSVTLAAKPQAVAVGQDERVLITTIGTGTGTSVLITYDPNADASRSLQSVVIAPAAPSAPQLPPPNGLMYLAAHARLAATPNGRIIVGVNELANNTRTVFVYDALASVVLASRNVAAISPILAVSPDGSKFLSGPLLFETSTLLVLAQQNATNSPYVFPAGANFNVQTSQGGAVYSPDGSVLYAGYNFAPVLNPAVPANRAQLTLNTPDTLLIQLGLQLPEGLGGKLAITSDGASIFGISQSGLIVIPIGTLRSQPIATPDRAVALLASDQCGVTASQNAATIPVRNTGGGRITPTVQVLTASATSAATRVTNQSYGGDVIATISAAAARAVGTSTPDQLLVQAAEAINIVPNIRVFQNSRNTEQRGSIIPIDMGATTAGLTDLLTDTARQRLYLANPALNRIEVVDMRTRQMLPPIPTGQLPRSMAFGADNNTLYVANSGSETISIVDLTQNAVVGRVRFPPIPFNAAFGLITPALIASSQRGPQVLMSDGTLWRIVGDTVTPRVLNTNIFGTARNVPAPQSMASTPDGSFVLLLAGNGNAFLYSAADDDFVAVRTVISAPITGYYGPIAAGPNGQYFLTGDAVLNQALTTISSGTNTGAVPGGGLPRPGGPTATSRPVFAVSAAGAQSYVRFSSPIRANPTAAVTDSGMVEVVNVNTLNVTASAPSLEGPLAIAAGAARVNVAGRMMALDNAGSTAFVLTASGVSVVPLDPVSQQSQPQVSNNGVVSTANFLPNVAPNGLISIFGRNLGTPAAAPGTPLPTLLGGTCVTLNNAPIPLLAASAGQINAQIPTTLAAGRYPLVVRSTATQGASAAVTVNVTRYAPAVFLDSEGPMIFHKDGRRVDRSNPAKRDEPLVIYATGLGTTTGGRVTAGQPSPTSPLAVTSPIKLYFGNPLIKEAEIIVDFSGLMPGYIGVYQINCRVPGAHVKGESLPVTIRIGGVDSPVSGPTAAMIAVQ